MAEDVREKNEKSKGVLNKEPGEHQNQRSGQKYNQRRRIKRI